MSRVNQIEKGTYEGYIWYSDQKEPQVLEQQMLECTLDENVNPFIIEAQLHDSSARVSYSVKYIDGAYIAFKYENVAQGDVASDPTVEIEEKCFCANRMGDRQLVFQQWWREAPDAFCEGMKVLQPAESVFVGFKKEGGK